MNQSKKPGRRPAAGTTAAALDSLKQAVAGWPEAPSTLRASERTFWDRIMIARLPNQWAQIDLLHAANLARCVADIEDQREEVLREGSLIEAAGGPRLNPRLALIETLNRRAMSLTRVLQLQAVATIGAAQKQLGAKSEAATAAATMRHTKRAPADIEDLLARPRMQ